MSAFVVFSMMGFYPVTPGLPIYDIGSPTFSRTVIHLKNGKTFSIVAHDASDDNKYVESIRLNGKIMDRVWFRHDDMANGGVLEMSMGSTPNKVLGAAASSYPPAAIDMNPEEF